MEGSLRDEQRSVSNLRDALHVAQSTDLPQPSDAAQRAKIAMLQDEVRTARLKPPYARHVTFP